MRPRKQMALYDKSDNLLMVGDVYEIANYLGKKTSSLYSSISNMKKKSGTTLKYGMKLYEIEE